jgi:hypothetical protein
MSRAVAAALLVVTARGDLLATIDDTKALHKASAPYLSFNIDTGSIYNGWVCQHPYMQHGRTLR